MFIFQQIFIVRVFCIWTSRVIWIKYCLPCFPAIHVEEFCSLFPRLNGLDLSKVDVQDGLTHTPWNYRSCQHLVPSPGKLPCFIFLSLDLWLWVFSQEYMLGIHMVMNECLSPPPPFFSPPTALKRGVGRGVLHMFIAHEWEIGVMTHWTHVSLVWGICYWNDYVLWV